MDPEKAYLEAKQRFLQTAGLVSIISLLLMVASRIPTLEVSSPVAWVSGSINVTLISLVGPILILGGFCWVCLSAIDLVDFRNSLLTTSSSTLAPAIREVLLRLPIVDAAPYAGRIARFPLRLMDGFVFVIPVICYFGLFMGYLEFVRPQERGSEEWRYPTRSGQIADLFFGTGGLGGFQPILPSVSAALRQRSQDQKSSQEQKSKSDRLGDMPWIYPPWQTWAYLAGLGTLCVVSVRTWQTCRKSLVNLQRKQFGAETLVIPGDVTTHLQPSDSGKHSKEER